MDNKNKVVFNGSDLGKEYGAKAILEQLTQASDTTSSGIQPQAPHAEVQHIGEIDLHVNELLKDLVTAQAYDFTSPEAAMRKRRKKRKRKGRSL